jgi:hypothetical protein
MEGYESTKEAARETGEDLREQAAEIRNDFREILGGFMTRIGALEDETRDIIDSGATYMRHWARLLGDDMRAELRATVSNAVVTVCALFVGALGFLLLNMGVIWSLSAGGADVGQWFIIFGAAWILAGALLGLVGYSRQRRTLKDTTERMRQDIDIPRQDAKLLYGKIKEQRYGTSGPYGHA